MTYSSIFWNVFLTHLVWGLQHVEVLYHHRNDFHNCLILKTLFSNWIFFHTSLCSTITSFISIGSLGAWNLCFSICYFFQSFAYLNVTRLFLILNKNLFFDKVYAIRKFSCFSLFHLLKGFYYVYAYFWSFALFFSKYIFTFFFIIAWVMLILSIFSFFSSIFFIISFSNRFGCFNIIRYYAIQITFSFSYSYFNALYRYSFKDAWDSICFHHYKLI